MERNQYQSVQRQKVIPTTISEGARKFMFRLLRTLEEKNIDSKLDEAAIMLIANTYDTYLKATEILNREGLVVAVITNAGSNPKAHPAVKIQNDAQSQLTRLLVEFGLTPKSRKETTAISKEDAQDTPESPLTVFLKNQREVR